MDTGRKINQMFNKYTRMIKEETVIKYSATCDNCKDPLDSTHNYFGGFNDKAILIKELRNKEWTIDGDTHYCYNCLNIHDEDAEIDISRFKT